MCVCVHLNIIAGIFILMLSKRARLFFAVCAFLPPSIHDSLPWLCVSNSNQASSFSIMYALTHITFWKLFILSHSRIHRKHQEKILAHIKLLQKIRPKKIADRKEMNKWASKEWKKSHDLHTRMGRFLMQIKCVCCNTMTQRAREKEISCHPIHSFFLVVAALPLSKIICLNVLFQFFLYTLNLLCAQNIRDDEPEQEKRDVNR